MNVSILINKNNTDVYISKKGKGVGKRSRTDKENDLRVDKYDEHKKKSVLHQLDNKSDQMTKIAMKKRKRSNSSITTIESVQMSVHSDSDLEDSQYEPHIICGNYDLEDQPHTGRSIEINKERLQQLIEADPRLTTRELAAELGCVHGTIEKHLHELGKVSKYGVWIPPELSLNQL